MRQYPPNKVTTRAIVIPHHRPCMHTWQINPKSTITAVKRGPSYPTSQPGSETDPGGGRGVNLALQAQAR